MYKVKCDKCKNLIRSVHIKKTKVTIDNEQMILQYFECPRCRTIYKVLLLDNKAIRLQNEMLGYRNLYQTTTNVDYYSKYIIRKAHFESYLKDLEKSIENGHFTRKGIRIIYVPDNSGEGEN